MERPPKEYGSAVMMSGGYSMLSGIIVESRQVNTYVKLQRDGEPGEGVEFESAAPTVAKSLAQLKELSHTAAEHVGITPAEAAAAASRVVQKMEEQLISDSIISDGQSSRQAADDVVKNMVVNELAIPKSMGCLPFKVVSCYEEAGSRTFVWLIVWADESEEITTELRLDKRDFAQDYIIVRDRLQGQLQEKVALLRMQYPGDFEVECVDALGFEECFDEGFTYLAEESDEDGMIWVYDRFGEKKIYMESRFKRIQKVQVRIEKNREAQEAAEMIDSFDADYAWIKSGDIWEKRWNGVEDLMNFPVSDDFDGHTNKESAL